MQRHQTHTNTHSHTRKQRIRSAISQTRIKTHASGRKMTVLVHQCYLSKKYKALSFPKTHRDYFLQFRKILLSRPPLESVHLCLPLFLPPFFTVFETSFVCLFSLFSSLRLFCSLQCLPKRCSEIVIPKSLSYLCVSTQL